MIAISSIFNGLFEDQRLKSITIKNKNIGHFEIFPFSPVHGNIETILKLNILMSKFITKKNKDSSALQG